MVAKDKISYNIPSDWTVGNLFDNPLTTVIKPGVDIFEKKSYFATVEVNGTDISTGTLIEYETRESRANMQPTVNSVWFAKMKNSINGTFVVPTKFLCFPASKIHWKTELYVLQESAIRLLLLVNVHLFHKAVKKLFLLQVGELII